MTVAPFGMLVSNLGLVFGTFVLFAIALALAGNVNVPSGGGSCGYL